MDVVKKIRVLSVLILFIVPILLSGCSDDNQVTGNAILDLSMQEPLADETSSLKRIVAAEHPPLYSQNVDEEEEEAVVEEEEEVIMSDKADNDGADQVEKVYLLSLGAKREFRIDGYDYDIQLNEIYVQNDYDYEAEFEINNNLVKLAIDEYYDIDDNYRIFVRSIAYNEDENDPEGMIGVEFVPLEGSLKNRKYRDYLIFDDLGNYELAEAKNDDTSEYGNQGEKYVGLYTNDLRVEVIEFEDAQTAEELFKDYYSNDQDLLDHDGHYLYLPDKNGMTLNWYSDKFFVQVYSQDDIDDLEIVLDEYLKKYPSNISEELYCMQKEVLREGETETVTYGSKWYKIEVVLVSDVKESVVLKVDGTKTPSLKRNDAYTTSNNKLEINVKRVIINEEEGDSVFDAVELCFAFY